MFPIGLLFSCVIGAAVGSFLNVVICRLHNGKRICFSRSKCMSCGEKLTFFDLIPIVSFLVLYGKCRHCGKKIARQYIAVELATAAAFMILYVAKADIFGFFEIRSGIELLVLWVYTSFLIVIFVYDLKHYLILDKVLLPAYIFVLVSSLFLYHEAVVFSLLGSFVFGFFLLLLYHVSNGRWIGGGDVKLAFVLGFMVGFPSVIVTFVFAFVLGALVSVLLLLFFKKTIKSHVPFGTFLTVATYLSFFLAVPMLAWYMRLIYF